MKAWIEKRYTMQTTDAEILKDIKSFVAPVYRKDRLITLLPSIETPSKRKRGEERRTSKMKYWSHPKVLARISSSPSPSPSSSSSSLSCSPSPKKTRREKMKWTDEEVKLLLSEVPKQDYLDGNVSWAKVAKKFEVRTGIDCRDKMRNLMKPKKKLKF